MGAPAFPAAAVLLGLALLLGGGGSAAPSHGLAMELAAVAALALAGRWEPWRERPAAERALLLLLALAVLTPLLQLVPLPHPVWSRLAGRELAVQIDRLAGGGDWHPLTLDPEATWLAAASLLPPAAMLLLALRLDESARARLAALVVVGALLSATIGMLQAAGSIPSLYGGGHRSYPTGLFSNRNHQADLLLIGLIFSTALIARRRRIAGLPPLLALPVAAALAAGVVATTSRMGLLLLPLAIAGALLQFRPLPRTGQRMALLGAGTGILLAAGLIAGSDAARRTLQRFDGFSDDRFAFWADAAIAARRYFPWGSGLGTFDPVYRTVEDLNRAGPGYINHAHNDYLQIAIEAGLWGLVLVGAGLALFVRLALRRIAPARAPFRSAAAVSILILLLHSAVDYPLRMPGLLVLFALLWVLMLPAGRATPCPTPPKPPPS